MRGEKSNLRIMNKPLKYKFFDDGAGGSGSQIQYYADTVDPHTVDIFANPVIHKNSNTVDIFFYFQGN